MGIHDRHYVRDQPGGPGGMRPAGPIRSMRMWSANTWLIVICVSVFVVDGMLPRSLIQMKVEWAVDTSDMDRSVATGGAIQKQLDARGRVVAGVQPLIVQKPAGPQLVGKQYFNAMHPLERYLHFSTERGFFGVEFWRLVGFQFLHSHDGIYHLLFNMIGLFFFGSMVESFLGSKRYLAFYLLCGICGALMYVLLNLGGYLASAVFGATTSIPGLLFNDMTTPLIGASAGVFGVLMAGAYLAPNATVLVFFILPMKLRTLAYVLVGMSVLAIFFGTQNAGGEAGHLGGALAGFYFIRYPHHLHGFFDLLGRVDPTSHHYRGKRGSGGVRKRRGGEPGGRSVTTFGGVSPSRVAVDRILDKVHEKGLASLTDAEKKILREASERE